MPLFTRHPEPVAEPVPIEPEPKRHGLFGSKRDPSPVYSNGSTRHSSVRSSQDSSITRHSTDASSNRRSLLHRSFGHGNAEMDPSIVQARERVMSAETAEHEADRALDIARREVHNAREEVKRLEVEAKEQARLAKIKQFHAKEVSKRGKALGRHGF